MALARMLRDPVRPMGRPVQPTRASNDVSAGIARKDDGTDDSEILESGGGRSASLGRGGHDGTERPVYVLTGDATFSGAEEFAYDVQTQRRGEVVGDTTGGAHPGGLRRVSDGFGVWVPSGRAVNPVTGTNWEGVGVRPDVPAPARDALRVAHLRALERLAREERNPRRRALLRQAGDELRRTPAT